MALRTSKLSKNCASRGLVGPFRRAARAEKGPPGLQGGGGGAAAPATPPLATCLDVLRSITMRRVDAYAYVDAYAWTHRDETQRYAWTTHPCWAGQFGSVQ